MRRGPAVLAWLLWLAFAIVLGLSIQRGLSGASAEPITAPDVLWATSIIGFPTTGAVIASRQPRSPLGWLFLVAPLLLMAGVGAVEQALLFDLSGQGKNAAQWGWFGHVSMSAGTSLVGLMALLIPNGKLPSRRWRVIVAGHVIIATAWIFTAAFRPGPLQGIDLAQVENPYGLEGWQPFLTAMQTALAPIFMILFLLSLLSIPLRLRGASDDERQQLKWLGYGATVVVVCIAAVGALEALGSFPQVAKTLIITVAILAMPVAIGIAMLRYRLYDIDVVINRTLVYGLLTAVLAAAYIGLVFGLQAILAPFTAKSDLAIAGSTLAVAGLFRPARARIQDFIDRRFYRRKFDAEQTVEQFSAHLRDEVELASISHQLVDVIRNTMQPAHVSVWFVRESQ